MQARATVLGHPIHPMLVVVPLGALPVALLLGILHLATGDAAWLRAAFVATVLGEGGILLAVVPGAFDYARVAALGTAAARGRAARHMILGSALAVLFAVSAFLHALALGDGALAVAAVAVTALGTAGLALQAWLGAGLVVLDEVGVERAEAAEEAGGPHARS